MSLLVDEISRHSEPVKAATEQPGPGRSRQPTEQQESQLLRAVTVHFTPAPPSGRTALPSVP